MMKKTILLLALALGLSGGARAQKVAVKTNLLQWATTTPNLGVEITLGKRWTLDIAAGYNPWEFGDNKKLKHWIVQPEFRFWIWEPFNGHFLGVHGTVSQFNIGGVKLPFGLFPDLQKYRYEGSVIGGGITYGYQWMLGNRWGLEMSVGAGYEQIRYQKYQCRTCGLPLGPDGNPMAASPKLTKNYFGPTKASITLIFLIK